MKSKRKPLKKKGVKPKQGVVSKKTKTKWIKRVMPVAKTYKAYRFSSPEILTGYGEIRAYEDGIQVCIFNVEHQRAWDAAIFHLKALAYKETT